jgi:hypothetical protein
MSMAIIKPPKPFDVDQHILAMWLLYGSRPRNAEPDETGAFYIGDCGSDLPNKNWQRLTPYSLAKPE